MKIFIITLIVIILDQASKILIKGTMTLSQSFTVIGPDFFRITYVENTGIAFGISFGSPLFLTLFTFTVSGFIAYFLYHTRREGEQFSPRLALAMILGGAVGNLIDRVLYGKVVDFLDFDFPDIIITRWPVFNLADSAVTVGMVLLLVSTFVLERKKTTTQPQREE